MQHNLLSYNKFLTKLSKKANEGMIGNSQPITKASELNKTNLPKPINTSTGFGSNQGIKQVSGSTLAKPKYTEKDLSNYIKNQGKELTNGINNAINAGNNINTPSSSANNNNNANTSSNNSVTADSLLNSIYNKTANIKNKLNLAKSLNKIATTFDQKTINDGQNTLHKFRLFDPSHSINSDGSFDAKAYIQHATGNNTDKKLKAYLGTTNNNREWLQNGIGDANPLAKEDKQMLFDLASTMARNKTKLPGNINMSPSYQQDATKYASLKIKDKLALSKYLNKFATAKPANNKIDLVDDFNRKTEANRRWNHTMNSSYFAGLGTGASSSSKPWVNGVSNSTLSKGQGVRPGERDSTYNNVVVTRGVDGSPIIENKNSYNQRLYQNSRQHIKADEQAGLSRLSKDKATRLANEKITVYDRNGNAKEINKYVGYAQNPDGTYRVFSRRSGSLEGAGYSLQRPQQTANNQSTTVPQPANNQSPAITQQIQQSQNEADARLAEEKAAIERGKADAVEAKAGKTPITPEQIENYNKEQEYKNMAYNPYATIEQQQNAREALAERGREIGQQNLEKVQQNLERSFGENSPNYVATNPFSGYNDDMKELDRAAGNVTWAPNWLNGIGRRIAGTNKDYNFQKAAINKIRSKQIANFINQERNSSDPARAKEMDQIMSVLSNNPITKNYFTIDENGNYSIQDLKGLMKVLNQNTNESWRQSISGSPNPMMSQSLDNQSQKNFRNTVDRLFAM